MRESCSTSCMIVFVRMNFMNNLSDNYRQSAELIRVKLSELRSELRSEKNLEKKFRLERRIAELTPILTEMNELAELTARYYEMGYYRNEKFTCNGIHTPEYDRAKHKKAIYRD